MSTTRPMPTLSDVAQRAGVSTATVSRCLNTPDQVTDATRARVMDAIAELGYSPNFGARVMAAKRTHTIGAIIPTMENAIFARGLQAFQEELRTLGYTLLVASSSYRQDIEEEQVRALVARGAEGLLLIGHDRNPAVHGFLERQDVPTLVAWAHDPHSHFPSIGFDNRISMEALVREVVALGHTRFAMITAPTAENDRARGRFMGAVDALKGAGRSFDPAYIIETPYEIDRGAEAFRTLMGLSPRPTAIICGNDVLAIGALRCAREMGISVPDDVSITGFDDIELAQVAVPALATVHVPHRRMGREAAQMLAAMIEEPQPMKRAQLEPQLCLRASLGPVPQS
ncbi:MAG: LacI family DNA-binding transcriptional regulator [Pseudomonadota bacterium]